MPITVMMLTGDAVLLPDVALEGLRMAFRGGVFVRGEPGFEEAQMVWNAMIDKHPALIIRCMGTSEVIDAVNFARLRNLLVAVRSGGHSLAGFGTCDDGLVIDLSPMYGVHVDPVSRIARVQGGATWGGFDRETQAFGLATTGGVISNTGVAGLTLGGGIGYLRRKHGLSCDNLLSAEVVTSEGEFVRASDDENPDLFWALRGGGGNFGIVTSFEFQCHPVGPTVPFALVLYPIDQAPEIYRNWRDWQATVPNEVTSAIALWTVPEGLPLPEEATNKEVVVIVGLYAGDIEQGLEVLDPVRRTGTPSVDLSGPWPYRVVQAAPDPVLAPKGRVNAYFKSLYMQELSDDAIDLIIKRGLERPNSMSLTNLYQMGGAISEVGAQDTAFTARSAPFMFSIDGMSLDARDVESFVPWVREFWDEMQRFAGEGPFLNFLGTEDDNAQLTMSAHGSNYQRLAAIKKQYDPDNFFRLNQNISPED